MRILFVADAGSIHTARWLSQLEGTGWDLHLFDSAGDHIEQTLRGVTIYRGWYAPAPKQATVHYRWPFPLGNSVVKSRFPRIAERIVPEKGIRLARLIERLRPDCIHSLNMQYSAYPLFQAQQRLGGQLSAPWIYSCQGSDIYLFGKDPEHEYRIREVLTSCDYLITDCHRDVRLAREFGFRGENLGVFPCNGGHPIESMRAFRQSGRVSDRRVIAVKGYQKWAGRALEALQAIELCAEDLGGYKVVIYSANKPTKQKAREMASTLDIPIEILPQSPIEEIWKLFGQSRVAIGISNSDGTPNALLESMVMGAFPIQTDPGGVTSEWIENGVSGITVDYRDPAEIARAIRKATTDDELVNAAERINYEVTLERVDHPIVRQRVIELYDRILNGRTRN